MLQTKRNCFRCLQVCNLLMSFLILSTNAGHENIVEVKQGKVSGINLSVKSGYVTAYLGIPYGEPPTGRLRFKKTEQRKPWHGVLKADKFGKSCFQNRENKFAEFPGTEMFLVNNEMSEDCLHLNVWVPPSKPKDAHVMVFIHGGGFESGTTSLDIYDGSVLAYAENVIVVSMNYRVGAFGFLALPGHKDAPGNAGLFDQRLALQWINENIAAFGGNPDRVTIFGHSAGAASVGFHLISPKSYPYYNRAIVQSGSGTSNWALNSEERAKRLALKLAEVLECPQTDDDAIITCLLNEDPKHLTEKQLLAKEPYALTQFLPIVDHDFLVDVPENVLGQSMKRTDILLGITKDDGNPFTLIGSTDFNIQTESSISSAELLERLKRFFPSAGDLGIQSILLQYKDWEDVNNGEKNRQAMELILRDYYFACPVKGFARYAVEHQNNVFFYEYDHRSSNDPWPEWMGALHGAELPMLFGKPFINKGRYTRSELLFSKRIMKLWANFARTGSPNVEAEDGFVWPQYSLKDEKYAVLKLNGSEVHQMLSMRNCQFWNFFFPSLLKLVK
ncbi:cholinesterase [Xenopus tropicalis]|uniref:Carboxylic ester hydrolase n=2 Tax=Xenopus tropicalis TaxID=8364 RepID=A0A6I8PZR8_XENTR|nr:cholinesterase [Xenopus tropicalis]